MEISGKCSLKGKWGTGETTKMPSTCRKASSFEMVTLFFWLQISYFKTYVTQQNPNWPEPWVFSLISIPSVPFISVKRQTVLFNPTTCIFISWPECFSTVSWDTTAVSRTSSHIRGDTTQLGPWPIDESHLNGLSVLSEHVDPDHRFIKLRV